MRKTTTAAFVAAVSISLPAGIGLSQASATDLTQQGSVDRAGDYYDVHDMTVSTPGRYSAELTWAAAGADLNMFVKNPAGQVVGEGLATTGTVERLTVDIASPGNWKIAVKARVGSSSYTVALVPQDASAPPVDPPVDPPPAPPVGSGGEPAPGIYQVWGADSNVALPYVKGGQITLEWTDVEPAPGQFNWSKLDSALAYHKSLGKSATVQLNSTTAKPAWLWTQIAHCGKEKNQDVPQYWDPAYRPIQNRLITGLAAAIRRSPSKSAVTLVRASPNAIGTELTEVPVGRTCTGPNAGRFGAYTKTIGMQYYQDVMGMYRTAMNPDINFAHRTQLYTTNTPAPPLSWLGVNDAWIMGTASDIDPNPMRDAFDVFSVNWARAGKTQAYWEPHYTTGKNHLASWNYWRLLLELHKGVSYVAVYGQEIGQGANPEYRAAFDFVNRYAGSHASPLSSPGAFVALKQGTGRTAGNFTRFMTQVNPDGTSTAIESGSGAVIIGPTAQRFGRFARSVTGGTTKATMSFQLDPAFRTGIAAAATKVRVVYLDRGTGSFQVSSAPGQFTTVTKTGTDAWKEIVIDVPGAAFTAALPLGADLSVTALGADTSIFHMVEVQVAGR